MTAKAIKPDTIIKIGIDEVPLPSTYGAAEMKFFIRRNTYRGALVTLLLLTLLLIGNCVTDTISKSAKEIKVAPITRMSLEDLPPADADAAELPPPEVVINTGPAARAGNPVPVPDAQIAPDLQEFATVDVQDRAGHEGGTGEDLGGFAGNIEWDPNARTEVTEIKDKEPAPDEFIPVEKEPGVDMRKLQGLVSYPEIARRAGIEGTVIVRALVDKSGKITRTFVEYSDNKTLDAAAIKALQGYGYATPAVMNGQPVTCWLSIPIVFKLK